MATNRFDERAATWDDDPARLEQAEKIAAAIRDAVPLHAAMRMLEYGAGTGLVTQALRDAVGPVTLADSSAGMREVMERKMAMGALPGARVWDLDLVAGLPPPGEKFDVVVTVMTLHHIEDVAPVLSRFAGLLEEGGRLCIVDLEEEDGSFHAEDFHGHHGFDSDALRSGLEAAGFCDIAFRKRVYEIVREGRFYPLFLATGTRCSPHPPGCTDARG